MTEKLQDYLIKGIDATVAYAPRIVLGLVLLVVGWKVAGWVAKLLRKVLTKREVDPSLVPFLATCLAMLIKAAVVISVISYLGIPTTSFVAVLGAAGLAIGMALSGTLQNFAGGVMILLFRPYNVGEVIEAQGYIGKVKEIQIFQTILLTGDNKTVFIPNGPLANGSLINYSRQSTRRVDMTFGIGYGDDIDKARDAIKDLIAKDERILGDPAPQVVVGALADSSVNFTVRVWALTDDYWGIYFDMHEAVKKRFDADDISIPFPQQDIHLHKVEG